jgi:ABC-type nitrate/sulfonate/bicarbonate transport system permease component
MPLLQRVAPSNSVTVGSTARMEKRPSGTFGGPWLVPVLAPLVVLALLVTAWQLYAQTLGGALFPTPSDTVNGFWESARSGSVWRETAISWRALAIGYGVSVVLGVTFGLLLGLNRWVDRVFGVFLDISIVTPMIVVMPIVLIALGVNATAQVVVVIFFSMPYVTLPVRNGVRTMPQLWFDLSKMLCLSRLQTWRYVVLPGARGPITNGLRLGLAHALTGLLVVEFTLVALGIGGVVLNYRAQFLFGEMFGYLLLVMVQIVIVMTLINRLYGNARRAGQ